MNIILTDEYCDLRYDSRFLCEWFPLHCIFAQNTVRMMAMTMGFLLSRLPNEHLSSHLETLI